MKVSKYNVYAKTNKGYICFNTFFNSFVLLPPQLYSLITDKLYSDISEKQLEKLKNNHILIEDDEKELDILIEEHENSLSNKSVFELTLLPSLDCNLRCWYCFETHVKDSRIDVVTQESILKFIENLCRQDELKWIKIELFGGEPLLYFEEELYPLLNNIKSLAEKSDKQVEYFFVTNATCIKDEHLPLFKSLNANFQISIDGYKEKHNTVKKMKDKSVDTYGTVIDVIHKLTSYYDAYINLRINYDNNTLAHIEEVIQDILDINPKQLGIHLEKVWQLTGDDDNKDVRIKDIIKMIMANGFKVSYMNLSRRSVSCKASKQNQAVISYNGDVYKCSGRDFKENLQEGKLQSDGSIKWDEVKLSQRLSIKTYDNEYCLNCAFLPQCWGPCSQKLLETPDEILRYCQLKHLDMSLDDFIIYRFNNELVNYNLYKSNESNNI
jgi:uncharacterized protein